MQITKINSNKSISKKNTSSKTEGGNFSSHLSETQSTASTSSASSISSIMSVDSLLSLQEVGADSSSRKKHIKRGFDIVEQLDEIRIGLLTGKLSESTLNNLNGLINNWREADADGDLKELIDEIELRAAVELAKLGN